tara:strand:- start:931 stop:1383 length:453 start_codon:yes stop_codon:yes gene_type:complete
MISDFKPYIDRLRSSGLRPTKQRLAICKTLFGKPQTFHFTIESLKKIISRETNYKISIATLYNTVHTLRKKGYLKKISLQNTKTYFDTNTKKHHHFYDEDADKLSDIKNEDILVSKLPHTPKGKKIKEIEVIVRIASDNHNQRKIVKSIT